MPDTYAAAERGNQRANTSAANAYGHPNQHTDCYADSGLVVVLERPANRDEHVDASAANGHHHANTDSYRHTNTNADANATMHSD